MESNIYKEKYIKYKTKYLELLKLLAYNQNKKIQTGGYFYKKNINHLSILHLEIKLYLKNLF